jgi:aconitate hydratase
VIAKSFARIHLANLVNFGILPLTFIKKQGYADVVQGDLLELDLEGLKKNNLGIKNAAQNSEIQVEICLSVPEKDIMKAGGKLAVIKAKQTKIDLH